MDLTARCPIVKTPDKYCVEKETLLNRRMSWTFEQRIQRACDALVDRNLLEESQVETLHRPLYFGQYAYGIGLSLNLSHWGDWQQVKDFLQGVFESMDAALQSNQRTYQFNAFSSDPSMIRWFMRHRKMFTFNHVRVVDRSCWGLSLPKPRPKAKFYGEFGWRFEFKDPNWGQDPDNVSELEKLSGKVKLVTKPRSFLYLDKLSDVLIFKLIVSEQLLALEDRHNL